MKRCISLIGPPCSGKSTLGKEIAETLGYKYISSGDLARKMAKEDGDMSNLNAGKMAPEDRMREELYNALSVSEDVVLDGFPRFLDQYNWLVNSDLDYKFIFIIVDASINELFYRVAHRGRSDDVAIRERMDYYMEHTVPMIISLSDCEDNVIQVTNNDRDIDATVFKLVYGLRGLAW